MSFSDSVLSPYAVGVAAVCCLALIYYWLVLIFKIGVHKHSGPVFVPDDEYNAQLLNGPWYRHLNVGAMLFTPIWLLANNLFVLFLLYVLLIWLAPWGCLIFSLVMLFVGTRLSWSGGDRWGNDVERFEDEQYFWSFLGGGWLACMVLAVAVGSAAGG